MCGLVGLFGQIDSVGEKVFKTLLTLDVIRGKHSTGVAGYSTYQGYRVAKAGLNAIDFMDKPEFTHVMAPVNKCLMGHNRHATVGAINDQNAHPFEFEHIIGAHNGSLYASWKKLHNAAECTVDSQALYSEMNENGVEALWSKLEGPAALTWLDKRDHTIHLLRNAARPLFYVTANNGGTLLWASEEWMIMVAAGREGMKLDGKLHELPINTHLTFNLPALWNGKLTSTTEKVAPYVAPKTQSHYTGGGRSWDDYDEYGYPISRTQQHTTTQVTTGVAGKKHLEKEGVSVGDMVEFTVEVVRDYMSSGVAKVNVMGCTVNGTPIRILAMDTNYYSSIIDSMSEMAEGVYCGKVSGAIETGLTLAHSSIQMVAGSMAEYIMALDQLEETSDKDLEGAPRNVREEAEEKREQLAAKGQEHSDNEDPLKTPVIINYSVSCHSCRKLTRAYHLLDAQRMCIKCAKSFVESKKKALEQRHLH